MMRGNGSRVRILRALLATFVLAILCVALVQTARREPLANRSPASRSLLLLATVLQRGEDPATLKQAARELALSSPLEAAPFYLQASSFPSTGIDARIRSLMVEAQRRQPAFVAPRLWIVGDSVRRGDHRQAISDADVVLRVKPALRTFLLPLLIPYLNQPKAREELVSVLATFPVWRSNFLSLAMTSNAERSSLEQVLLQQPPSDRPTSAAADQSLYLTRLVDSDEAGAAWQFYKRLKPGAAATPVRDGRFEGEEQTSPFEWRFASSESSYATRIAPTASPNFLRVHHDGKSEITLVEQRLVLPAGRWRFEIRQRSAGLADPSAFRWEVTCGGNRMLARSALSGLGESWTVSAMTADVPGVDCAQQSLRLLGLKGDGVEAEVEIAEIGAARL